MSNDEILHSDRQEIECWLNKLPENTKVLEEKKHWTLYEGAFYVLLHKNCFSYLHSPLKIQLLLKEAVKMCKSKIYPFHLNDTDLQKILDLIDQSYREYDWHEFRPHEKAGHLWITPKAYLKWIKKRDKSRSITADLRRIYEKQINEIRDKSYPGITTVALLQKPKVKTILKIYPLNPKNPKGTFRYLKKRLNEQPNVLKARPGRPPSK